MNLTRLSINLLVVVSAISLFIFASSQTFGNGFTTTNSSVKDIIYGDDYILELSDEEKQWLKQQPVVKLGIDRAFPPFGSITKENEYIGFSADIMRMIGYRLSLKFDIQINAPWNETMQMAKAGEIDMISALVNSEQRQSFLNFSTSYIKNPTIIINDAEQHGYVGSLKNLNGQTVAIERGSYSAGVLSKEYPLIKLVPVENTSIALSLVSIGQADAYVGNGVTASYLIRKLGYHNLSYSGQTEYASSHSIGFTKQNIMLARVVQKALSSISKPEIDTIENFWFGFNTQSVINKKTALIIGFGLLFILATLTIWAISLKRAKNELKVSQKIIKKQSEVDFLTGLGNRRQFYKYLENVISRSKVTRSEFTVIFLDLDLFKEVNDSLGHAIGDLLLVEASRRLIDCVPETLGGVFRIGGDEFMLILPNVSDKKTIEKSIACINSNLNKTFEINGNAISITTSIGITRFPNDASKAKELVINGDQAMYASKKKGRNCYSYFDKRMFQEAQHKASLIRDMRLALEANEFTLHYQPIINLSDNSITKAEALIRWHHPTRGLVSPAEFIPLAEEAGLINQIGEWVFRTAIDHTVEIQKQLDQTFQMSINTSPLQYRNNGIDVTIWFEYIQSCGLTGENIIVEITEGVLMEARESVINRLFQLRDLKVGVAIDDFGTGYSSLSYLRKFDIDFLKIDQSFVRNLTEGSDDLVLVQAIVVMAHQLGIKVVAEGVETKIQNDILVEAGCDYGQGFYFSRGLEGDAFLSLLDNWPGTDIKHQS